MSDPREPIERRDPREGTPDVGGPAGEQENAASDLQAAQEEAAQEEVTQENAANDLDADIAIEEDTLKTVDPDNRPA
jgi:hypothetical protein